MDTRARVGFGIGNLVTAALLVLGVYMLPVRYLLIDALLVIGAVVAVASSIATFAKLPSAPLLLRIAAFALLGLGLIAVALAVLTLSFLAGVHGRWLEAGIPIATYALGLIIPYTIVYPIVQLLAVAPEQRGTAA